MLKIKKINLQKTRRFLEKLPVKAANNIFRSFLVLLSLSLLLGAFVLWRFYFSSTKEEVAPSHSFKFDDRSYQQVLTTWEEKEESLKETDSKQYPDLFNP